MDVHILQEEGLKDNLSRIIPKGKCAKINLNKIKNKKSFFLAKKK